MCDSVLFIHFKLKYNNITLPLLFPVSSPRMFLSSDFSMTLSLMMIASSTLITSALHIYTYKYIYTLIYNYNLPSLLLFVCLWFQD